MDKIYEEKIFDKWGTVILALPTILFLLFSILPPFLPFPIDADPVPNWIFLFALAMFLLCLGFTINFSTVSIKMTPQYILVSYGIFKRKIPWENIEDCYLGEASIGRQLSRYGGWGIRLTKVKGKWMLMYNVIGGPCVELSLNKGKFRGFGFSTNNPQKVIEIVKQKIGKTK